MAQGRVPGTEIIQPRANAQFAEALKGARGRTEILNKRGLRELDDQILTREFEFCEKLAYLLRQIGSQEGLCRQVEIDKEIAMTCSMPGGRLLCGLAHHPLVQAM